MSIATAIELFNHPVLNPTKQLNTVNRSNDNCNKRKLNDELHQHAIFGSIESTLINHIHNPEPKPKQPQTEFDLSANLWAHNEKLLTALNSINNRILNGASININNSSFFKAIYHYLSQFNDTKTYDISIGLTIMKLLYNVSDMFPHTILYIITSKIPQIILQILKSGFKSYNPDEFSLHIEYINVLEYISRYSYQHSLVIHQNTRNNHEYNDHYYLHDQDAQTAKKVVSHLIDMSVNEDEKASGIIDCILTNISLHDKKDVVKALSILAQIFACCLCNNSSVPICLKVDKHSKQLDQIQQGVQSLEQRLHEMQQKARDSLTPDAFLPFQNKLNELKSQIDKELKRGGIATTPDEDDSDDDSEDGEDEYDRNLNRNNVSKESNVIKRNKILHKLSNEVKMHSDYIASILKHNFSEIEMVDNILCFLCNFTQILLVHNAFDEVITVFSERFVKELMQFALRCYHCIIQSQRKTDGMEMDQDEEDSKNEIESDEETPISDVNNAKYCQFVVIVLRILYQILCITQQDVTDDEERTKWNKIAMIQQYLMCSCHIEKLYNDLVIVDQGNTNIIRINDTCLLETIIILGQTLSNDTMRKQLIHDLLCILVEYGRDIDSSSINLILHSLNKILTDNLLIMARQKSNDAFLIGIYQQNNQKICELISFILEKNHDTNHLNIVLLKHTLQILLNWYDFTKMLKQNSKVLQMKQNLKKYGADLMITHWKKLLKERYPNYSSTKNDNDKEMKQIQTVMNTIRKARRILDLEDMDQDSSDSESDTDSSSEEEEDMEPNKSKTTGTIWTVHDIDVMADDMYFDYVAFNLNELLSSTQVTTADHLKKLGEMLLNMTRTDHRICHTLSNGSMSTAENNRLFVHKTAKQKHYKYWRLYSLYIQSILKDRDLFNHFRILLSIRCLLHQNHLTKYQFIASGIIDILLHYLTVTQSKIVTRTKQSPKAKQKQKNVDKIKMDLLHDRQRLFAFVFFFDLDEKYLQMHLCDPEMYSKIIEYKNKAMPHIQSHKKSQSIKYLIHLLLQCLNMDVFPVRTIKTRQNHTQHTSNQDDESDITMKNQNSNNSSPRKQFSFGSGSKSQQIDKYYYELKLLSERVLMINVCHDIEQCVVAQSLHFNHQHQLYQWEQRAKLKLQKQREADAKAAERAEGMEEDNDDNDDEGGGGEEPAPAFAFANPMTSVIKDRHKQKIKLPTQTASSCWSGVSSFGSNTFNADPAPFTPIRAVNFSVTGHLFMTVSDITKVFITKYEALKKYKYKNPSQLLTDIGRNTIDKEAKNTIDLSSFLIHHCANGRILSQFLDKDDKQKEDIASLRASQLLQNGLELVVTYNGIELPKNMTVLQALLAFDYPQLFNDDNASYYPNGKTFEDITESRHIDDEENEFSFRPTYSKRDRHVFNIYFRWKQQNRIKPTHSNKPQTLDEDNGIQLDDLINPTRYLDQISHRSESLLPVIALHTHKTRRSSRRRTVASTNSLLLNSPPGSPSEVITATKRGRKRKLDKMEADSSTSRARKRRKLSHHASDDTSTDYTALYRDGTQTIALSNACDTNNSNTTRYEKGLKCDLNHQHFPPIPSKWSESLHNDRIGPNARPPSKWKHDGPTQIILKLLNYFHGFSSHWTSLYYDDFYEIETVFDFNQPLDINQVKMKYLYNDANEDTQQQTDDIQCLLKPHVFYNKELMDRLKNQMEQSILVLSDTVHDWIKEIPSQYPFLFPYHIRKDVFDIFSFGPSRTFKNLVQFLKKCHHNSDAVRSDNNPQPNAVSAHSLSLPTHSDGLRQTNVLNIPCMSPLFHNAASADTTETQMKEGSDHESKDNDLMHKSTSNHTFSMIHSMLTNENCMIPKETHKTVKMYRKNLLSDVCALFHSSKYFSPLLSYYHFQTFRYHTSEPVPSDSFRDELALYLLPDPERMSSIAVSRPRYTHRIPRNVDFNQTNGNTNSNNKNNNNASSREESTTPSTTSPTPPKRKKKKKVKKKNKSANETQLQYLPILSDGVVEFNYDHDPFTTHFSDSILRVQFYGDDGVGSGPTMEFFTLATNGLDRQDLQLWIDDDTHIESIHNDNTKTYHKKDVKDTNDALYALGVYRCSDCTLINSIVCCPHHPDTPLSCYENKNKRGNIGIQSGVDELLFCSHNECTFHCHSDANFESLKSHTECRYCAHKCDIYFWVISAQCIQALRATYPANMQCLPHPLMQCDCCKMISFPVYDDDLLLYAYGGVYDTQGRSYPIHYLSSHWCFKQHCNPFCYRSDINMTPIILHKSFLDTLHEHITHITPLDLNHYQNIVCLSSGKSRKMRISGTRRLLTGDEASRYKSSHSSVEFICASSSEKAKEEEEEEKEETADAHLVMRNHMSHVTGYNGLFYRPNLLSFISNSPLHSNSDKYLHVLGKIMVLSMKENKRINVELHKMFFQMVLRHDDVNILDMLRIYPNDHYLMILFRLFNIYLFYAHMNTYCAYFKQSMDVEEEEDTDEEDTDLSDDDEEFYTSDLIANMKRKCESFVDVLGLTMNTPTLNISLADDSEGVEELCIDNIREYLIGICNYFLHEGISKPNACVESGLRSMMREDTNGALLLPFYDYEFETLIIGSHTQHLNEWTPKYLGKHVKLEQYSRSAQVIKNLFHILCNEFDIKQKRQFIRFLTGSLSLPLGGLSKLNPQFTITKFISTEQQFLYENAECQSLPHATTCRHTLRLPPYKTKETLKAKLLQAMDHAQTGFYLS